MKNYRVVFMGTPLFAIPVLEYLLQEFNVVGIITQPDHILNGKTYVSPVKELGLKHNINVIQPISITDEYFEVIALKPDIVITCAYGQIIPREILVYPKYGCINVHASLLPKLRGGAPIQRAIMNGLEETGITIMYMNQFMDEGDIISQSPIKITMEDNFETLSNRLSILGRDLLKETLPLIFKKKVTRTPQKNIESTYALTIKRKDEKIEFSKSSWEIYNKVRALYPNPGAYCLYKGKPCKIYKTVIGSGHFGDRLNGEIVKVYNDGIGVKTSTGEIIITELKPEGKKTMTARDFLNGIQDKSALIGVILE